MFLQLVNSGSTSSLKNKNESALIFHKVPVLFSKNAFYFVDIFWTVGIDSKFSLILFFFLEKVDPKKKKGKEIKSWQAYVNPTYFFKSRSLETNKLYDL